MAYGSLLQERRRALHTRIAEAIARLYADRLTEQVERLAYHALRGELFEKAVAYLRQAAAKAFARSAYREAATGLEQALVTLPYLPESRETSELTIELRLELRDALHALAAFERILEALRPAEALAEALADRGRLVRISALMANCLLMMGDPHGAAQQGQQTLAVASELDDIAHQGPTNFVLGQAYHALGAYQRAMPFLRRNVEAPEGELLRGRLSRLTLLSVNSRTWLVWCLAELGAFAEATTRVAAAVQRGEAADEPDSCIQAYYGVGLLFLRKGEPLRAIPVLEQALDLSQSSNVSGWSVQLAPALGAAYTLAGRVAAAIPLFEQAVESAAAR